MGIFGFLDSVWNNIELEEAATPFELVGQRVTLERDDINAVAALDFEKRLHFLLTPAPLDLERLSKFNLKGLTIQIKDWKFKGARKSFLDISCAGTSSSSQRRPFSKFCEDLIVELNTSRNSVEATTFKVFTRWKHFWEETQNLAVNPEWERGLLAELLFLGELLKLHPKHGLEAWVGPMGADHDFQRNRVAIEVKSTTSMPAKILINNLRQLDYRLFDLLSVNLCVLSRSENGVDLPSIVKLIEKHIGNDQPLLSDFWMKLKAAGYHIMQEPLYLSHKYTVDETQFFHVTDAFPAITESSFNTPIDERIESVRYSIRLSNLMSVGLETVEDIKARICS